MYCEVYLSYWQRTWKDTRTATRASAPVVHWYISSTCCWCWRRRDTNRHSLDNTISLAHLLHGGSVSSLHTDKDFKTIEAPRQWKNCTTSTDQWWLRSMYGIHTTVTQNKQFSRDVKSLNEEDEIHHITLNWYNSFRLRGMFVRYIDHAPNGSPLDF